MPKLLPKLKPIDRITATAAVQQETFLAPFSCRSYPIPAPGLAGLHILFLYSKAFGENDDVPRWIGAPEYLVSIDAETGKLAELRPFHPTEIGLPETQWLGQDHAPARRQQPDFVDQEKNLFRCYDSLLPVFGTSLQPVPSEVVAVARTFSGHFGFLMEQPLLPYYQRLGSWFFSQINSVIK